jgi:hypothetical protein
MLVTRRLSRLSSIAKHRVRSKCNISQTPGEVRPRREAFTETIGRVPVPVDEGSITTVHGDVTFFS